MSEIIAVLAAGLGLPILLVTLIRKVKAKSDARIRQIVADGRARLDADLDEVDRNALAQYDRMAALYRGQLPETYLREYREQFIVEMQLRHAEHMISYDTSVTK